MDSKLSYRDSTKTENQMNLTEGRRFRERQGQPAHPSENPQNYMNCKQFNFKDRKFEVGMWIDAKDTID